MAAKNPAVTQIKTNGVRKIPTKKNGKPLPAPGSSAIPLRNTHSADTNGNGMGSDLPNGHGQTNTLDGSNGHSGNLPISPLNSILPLKRRDSLSGSKTSNPLNNSAGGNRMNTPLGTSSSTSMQNRQGGQPGATRLVQPTPSEATQPPRTVPSTGDHNQLIRQHNEELRIQKARKTAMGEAQAALGRFVGFDSKYGNLIMPALPRFDSTAVAEEKMDVDQLETKGS